MAKVKLSTWAWKCERCDHQWIPRDKTKEPKVCPNPKCKSPYWNVPRRKPKK